MSFFDDLDGEVNRGLSGQNEGIPMGFDRLNEYVSLRKALYFVLGGLTGCLSGDTIISVNRGKRTSGREYTLTELYYKFNGKLVPRDKSEKVNGNPWDNQPSRILSYYHDSKILRYNDIVNVFESGLKEVFKLVTKSGKSIKATKNHRFLVNDSDLYKRLEELKVGDNVFIRSMEEPKGRKPRPYRKELTTKLPYYPSATDKKVIVNGIEYTHQRIKVTRAVYDAEINNVSLDEFLKNVKTNPDHNYVFSDVNMDIHHKDEDHSNDVFENLQLMTKSEHARYHGKMRGDSHFSDRNIQKDEIVLIESCGIEMTYDIEMKSPYNNFLANDIIVHNSGKSSLCDDAFVLNPIDWYIKEGNQKMRLNILYWSMERSKRFKFAKWVCRKIFLDTGIIIPMGKLLGWWKNVKMTKDEHDLYKSYKWYLDAIEEVVTIYEGKQNPIGIAEGMKKHALERGNIEKIGEFEKIYIPEREDELTVCVVDHIGLTKTTKDLPSKKQAIDKLSDEAQYARDFYGFTCAFVQQFNRDISNPIRLKQGDVEPTLEDFKESSVPQEDADVVMALFDPMRYKVQDPSGYDLDKLVDQYGHKYFRSLRVIKNTYGPDDLRIGLGFLGEIGMFKELPKRKFMRDEIYDSVLEKTFFL